MEIRPQIIPVIHYADDSQALRNAERAFDAACDGVMLIEMRGFDYFVVAAAREIKARWPDRIVGVNFLNATSAHELPLELGLDATWTDAQLTHSVDGPWVEAQRVREALGRAPGHLLFCGVSFKYQAVEPDAGAAARKAIEFGFIPTTSGPATGAAADPSTIASLREKLGPSVPLAIASGITPENASVFLPHVSHVLVSTGVSSSFHEFDPARLRALTEAAEFGRKAAA